MSRIFTLCSSSQLVLLCYRSTVSVIKAMKMYKSSYRSKRVFQLLLYYEKKSTAVGKNGKVIKMTHIVAVQELSAISIFLFLSNV